MASYRPFPPPPLPIQNSLPPPPLVPLPQPRGSQDSQNWRYSGRVGGDGFSQTLSQIHPNSSFQHVSYVSSSSQPYVGPPTNPIHHPQHYSYPPSPPPPPSMFQNSMNLHPPQPAPPAQMYYPSSQYSQFNHQPLQKPLQPPPPPPPPSSSIPPPPPPPPSQPPSPPPFPSSVPVASQSNKIRPAGDKESTKDNTGSGWREPVHSNQRSHFKQHVKPSVLPLMPARKSNLPSGRIETEEERRLRKKRELEKQRQEEKHRQQLKASHTKVLQKTHMLSSGLKRHGSISGSYMGDRRTTTFLSGERAENRLKKPTTFLCKLK